ncbi:MAG: tRNA (pseudouridine(54)-N(1))-methyltransferase TrmY [Nanoarchaeota archaeon]
MREFIYFSANGRTSGNFSDLMQAGRLDIAIHVIIASFFLSNKLRDDVRLHLILNGSPDPPKHLEFISNEEMPISKKDVSGLIKRMLYKYRKGQKVEVFPGCHVEKKSFGDLINELKTEGKKIYLLDKKGKDIRDTQLKDNAVFILGDHEGLPKKEMKVAEKISEKISVGPTTYFASQVVVLIQNELDRKGI